MMAEIKNICDQRKYKLQESSELSFTIMGVMPVKNHFDFQDMMTLSFFLLALLIFILCFVSSNTENHPDTWQLRGWFFYLYILP